MWTCPGLSTAHRWADGTINVSYNMSSKAVGTSLCALNRIVHTVQALSLPIQCLFVPVHLLPSSVNAALIILHRQQQCSPPTLLHRQQSSFAIPLQHTPFNQQGQSAGDHLLPNPLIPLERNQHIPTGRKRLLAHTQMNQPGRTNQTRIT